MQQLAEFKFAIVCVFVQKVTSDGRGLTKVGVTQGINNILIITFSNPFKNSGFATGNQTFYDNQNFHANQHNPANQNSVGNQEQVIIGPIQLETSDSQWYNSMAVLLVDRMMMAFKAYLTEFHGKDAKMFGIAHGR